jgi:hypothetical protein
MFYLSETLELFFHKTPKELTEQRQYLPAFIGDITDYKQFFFYYKDCEFRLLNALDNYHVVMSGIKQADMADHAVRWACLSDLVSVEARIAAAETQLRDCARLFVINHFENRAGFELNKSEYWFTADFKKTYV